MFKEIAGAAVDCGGTVFGGYVRDFLIHDESAKEFYNTNKSEDYAKEDVNPETIDRLLLPTDIDIHFDNKAKYREFRTSLRNLFYTTHVEGIGNLYNFGPRVHHIKLVAQMRADATDIIKNLELKPWMVSSGILRSALSSVMVERDPVKIDVILSQSFPDENLDFRCNGLVLDSDGIHLSKQLTRGLKGIAIHRMFMDVMGEIRNKRAVVVSENLRVNRWDKMEQKGWNIIGETIDRTTDTDMCLLCHDEGGDYKLKCCSARYHRECLSNYITRDNTGLADTNKCPHCRQNYFMSPRDVMMFGAPINNE